MDVERLLLNGAYLLWDGGEKYNQLFGALPQSYYEKYCNGHFYSRHPKAQEIREKWIIENLNKYEGSLIDLTPAADSIDDYLVLAALAGNGMVYDDAAQSIQIIDEAIKNCEYKDYIRIGYFVASANWIKDLEMARKLFLQAEQVVSGDEIILLARAISHDNSICDYHWAYDLINNVDPEKSDVMKLIDAISYFSHNVEMDTILNLFDLALKNVLNDQEEYSFIVDYFDVVASMSSLNHEVTDSMARDLASKGIEKCKEIEDYLMAVEVIANKYTINDKSWAISIIDGIDRHGCTFSELSSIGSTYGDLGFVSPALTCFSKAYKKAENCSEKLSVVNQMTSIEHQEIIDVAVPLYDEIAQISDPSNLISLSLSAHGLPNKYKYKAKEYFIKAEKAINRHGHATFNMDNFIMLRKGYINFKKSETDFLRRRGGLEYYLEALHCISDWRSRDHFEFRITNSYELKSDPIETLIVLSHKVLEYSPDSIEFDDYFWGMIDSKFQ